VTASSRGIGRAVALRLSRDGVAVAVTDTDGLIMPQAALDRLIQQTPLGRLGQPQDIADVVAFLVGDNAHWMTGQNLQVNGGIL
jgi:3-oxoacyl-[acyl-carrier protein] reductase